MKPNDASLNTAKTFARKELLQSLQKVRFSERVKKSAIIDGRVLKTKIFKQSQHVLFYAATRAEVATKRLMVKAFQDGKHVYLPKVNLRGKKLEIFEIKDPKRDLQQGFQGILEPLGHIRKVNSLSDIELVVVPGLGFTRRGVRLGRGGGYYDRFLKRLKKCYKLGIAFREQIKRTLPSGRYDVLMDRVITD